MNDMAPSPPDRGRRIGYARVSTADQHEAMQLDALRAAGCPRIFVEAASASSTERPEFQAALKALRAGDTLVIWKLDRAFRSTIDAITTLNLLRERQVDILVTTLGFVSDTPEGRYFYRGLASSAEFERDMISVRTKEGLKAARRRGRRLGRPRALTTRQVMKAYNVYTQRGLSKEAIAVLYGVSRSTVDRAFREHCTASSSIGGI